jgi:hypothetical protein
MNLFSVTKCLEREFKVVGSKDESVFATFGNPFVLVADRGSAICSTAFINMCDRHGVTVELIPSYQPE